MFLKQMKNLGCTGEGGTYDRAAKDICYSTSPTPTAPTPTAPTPTAPTPTAPTPTAPTPTPPTSNAGCVDSPFRFKVKKDGKFISRDCTWVSNRATASRCKLTGVKEHCPDTCSSCSTCVDSISRIQFTYNGKKVTRDCAWVENRNTVGRCRISGMTETCRVICGTC